MVYNYIVSKARNKLQTENKPRERKEDKTMKTTVEMLFDLYQEICKEAKLEWTLEGWKFFDQVMVQDYLNFCKAQGIQPNMKKFKKDCVSIAKGMKKQAR